MIGAFAGAFLSIAVIVVSYLFNDTIIDTEGCGEEARHERAWYTSALMNRRMTESKERAESMAEAATERKEKEIGFSIRKPVSGDGQMELVKFGKLKRTKLYDEGITSSFEDKYTVCRDDIRTLLVTSSVPNEGKSTVALIWRGRLQSQEIECFS